jgi:hypothetical protein
MSFLSPNADLAIDVVRDNVSDIPRRDGPRADFAERYLENNFLEIEGEWVVRGFGRAYRAVGLVPLDEEAQYTQITYTVFLPGNRSVYRIIGTYFYDEAPEPAPIALLEGIMANVSFRDELEDHIALTDGGFRAIVPDDWELAESTSPTTVFYARQPDDIALMFILLDPGPYDNPTPDFLQNTAVARYPESAEIFPDAGDTALALGEAYAVDATYLFEPSSGGDPFPIYNRDYFMLLPDGVYVGVYLSVDEETAVDEDYGELFREIAASVIPVSGETRPGGGSS